VSDIISYDLTVSSMAHLKKQKRRRGDGVVSLTGRPHRGAGEFGSIIGASGSGKSTLLTIAGGAHQADGGEVVVEWCRWRSELDPRHTSRHFAPHRASVFQDFNLGPALHGRSRTGQPGRWNLDGWKTIKARRAARDAARVVELGDRASHYPPRSLSPVAATAIRRSRGRSWAAGSLILADGRPGALESTTGDTGCYQAVAHGWMPAAGGILFTHDPRHAAWADRIVFLATTHRRQIRERNLDALARP